MPTLAMFYGLVVSMYFDDVGQHRTPHFHVRYAGHRASVSIQTAEVLAGHLPPKQLRLVQAWVEIHREELEANWQRALTGYPLQRIAPLT